MASRNEQKVVFALEMRLPPGCGLDEARKFIQNSIIAATHTEGTPLPLANIPSESIKARLLQRTIMYR